MIHHVQLACPPGSEPALRAFYVGILHMNEKPKPPSLAVRGGCWFTGYDAELHLGVEEDFRPARKAHPGLLLPARELSALAERLAAAGYPVIWSDDLPGLVRFHSEDPHGNRIEFLAARSQLGSEPASPSR